MNYTVVWTPTAEADLTTLWINALDRAAVAAAADEMDHRLAHDPLTEGESRSGITRILFVPPLVILYDVLEEDRLVSVWAVGRTASPP
jgi:plasmid stabilization system protein ParE